MGNDYLAEWISEYPSLLDVIADHPHMLVFFRRTPLPRPEKRYKKVGDEEWARILLEMNR